MSAGELLDLALSFGDLTETAQEALRAEFRSRRLELPEDGRAAAPSAEARPMVTVAEYRDLSEAIVARTALESAGIGATLRDENTLRLSWQMSNLLGGIRLDVSEADAGPAKNHTSSRSVRNADRRR